MAASTKKPMFHSPQKTGEVRPVPMSTPVKILSILSLVVLAAVTAFAIYAMIHRNNETVELSPQFSVPAGTLFLFLPIVGWLIAAGFRLAIRFIPLEMWRLPAKVKAATIKTQGKYLKIASLLIELETAIAFGYITWSLYQGMQPGDAAVLVWVAAIAATIIGFGRYVLIAADRMK